jgi:CRISPR/Cas system-associated exonuclease Cas4 (RecB family)
MSWKVEYLDGNRRPNARMFLGSMFHGLLEEYYSGVAVNEDTLDEVYYGLLEEESEWEGIDSDDLTNGRDRAWDLFMKYCEHYDDKIDVVETEVMIERPPLRGKIDLLFKYKGKKGLWVMEHKTKSRFMSQPYDWQVIAYTYLKPEITGVVYNQVKTYEFKTPQPPGKYFERVPLFASQDNQDRLISTANEVIAEMNAIEAGKREPRATFVNHICSMCGCKSLCPLFVE